MALYQRPCPMEGADGDDRSLSVQLDDVESAMLTAMAKQSGRTPEQEAALMLRRALDDVAFSFVEERPYQGLKN